MAAPFIIVRIGYFITKLPLFVTIETSATYSAAINRLWLRPRH